MSAEGESSPNHVVVPTDTPGTASAVDMATNKHILNNLNNIDQTIGQMLHPTLMSPGKNINITLVAQILKEHEKIVHRTTI